MGSGLVFVLALISFYLLTIAGCAEGKAVRRLDFNTYTTKYQKSQKAERSPAGITKISRIDIVFLVSSSMLYTESISMVNTHLGWEFKPISGETSEQDDAAVQDKLGSDPDATSGIHLWQFSYAAETLLRKNLAPYFDSVNIRINKPDENINDQLVLISPDEVKLVPTGFFPIHAECTYTATPLSDSPMKAKGVSSTGNLGGNLAWSIPVGITVIGLPIVVLAGDSMKSNMWSKKILEAMDLASKDLAKQLYQWAKTKSANEALKEPTPVSSESNL